MLAAGPSPWRPRGSSPLVRHCFSARKNEPGGDAETGAPGKLHAPFRGVMCVPQGAASAWETSVSGELGGQEQVPFDQPKYWRRAFCQAVAVVTVTASVECFHRCKGSLRRSGVPLRILMMRRHGRGAMDHQSRGLLCQIRLHNTCQNKQCL